METGIVILIYLVGLCMGLIVGMLFTKRTPIGTLRIIYSEDEPLPYTCLELDTPMQNVEAHKTVLMRVKLEYYSSQE